MNLLSIPLSKLNLSSPIRILLISEPRDVADQICAALNNRGVSSEVDILEEILGHDWSEQVAEYDLCQPMHESIARIEKYDLVICQSLLEHVVDPVQVLRNLISLTKEFGIVAIQTCNPFIIRHYYPIDTLRFNPDWFRAASEHLGVQLIESFETKGSIYGFFGGKGLS